MNLVQAARSLTGRKGYLSVSLLLMLNQVLVFWIMYLIMVTEANC